MLTRLSNKIYVTGYSPALFQWARQNLRIRNSEYDRKVRMGMWTGKTPEYIDLYEVHGDTLVLPAGVKDRVWQFLLDGDITEDYASGGKVDFGEDNLRLYDYQQACVDSILQSGNTCGIIQAPAGCGKTIMALKLIKALGLKALWVTHTTDLLGQSRARALGLMEDFPLLGTIRAGSMFIGNGITFATVQTLSKQDLQALAYEWDVVIVDECHRVGKSATSVTMFEKVLANLKARYKFGLSATVHRADGMIEATKALLGDVIYQVPDDAVAERVMPVTVKAISTNTPIGKGCLKGDGTLDYVGTINYLSGDEERNLLIRDLLIQEEGHCIIVLSDRLNQLSCLQEMLPKWMQGRAVRIDGSMQSKRGRAEREEAIRQVREGEKDILFASYGLAKEGLDIPRLDRLVMATPHSDYAVLIQALGRIARVHEGKGNPIAYDLVDTIPFCLAAFRKRARVYQKQRIKVC